MTGLLRQAGLFILGLSVLLLSTASAADTKKPVEIPTPPKVFEKKNPTSVEDLKEIEKHIAILTEKLSPTVVNLKLGGSEGSGVVVSEDGYILTAGHVTSRPNLAVLITFPDEKTAKGKSLGVNHDIDSGMVQITDEGKWTYAEMGKVADLKKGDWVLTLGHPNGYKKGRPPVVRVGRILGITKATITTDTVLVGGDSGGPVFDMKGRVIGIHSRIGETIHENVHVPIDTYRETWKKLAEGENIGGIRFPPKVAPVYLGIKITAEDDEIIVTEVEKDSPAEKEGIEEGDVILKLDDKPLSTIANFNRILFRKKPDDELSMEIRRGDKTKTVKVKLARNPQPKKD
jgi:serine protease Do